MFDWKWASRVGLVAAAVLGAGSPICAAPAHFHSGPLGFGPPSPTGGRDLLPYGEGLPPSDNRAAPAPRVARYLSVEGQSFVFDRIAAAPDALLRFDDDPEIWVLHPSPAPRGDTMFRDDVGDAVLRLTRLGGVTLYTPQDPAGLPAAMLGEAEGLTSAPVIPPGALLQRLVQASARSSRAAQHLIAFDAPNVTPQTSALFSDAFAIAADAIARLSRRTDARAFLTRLDRVLFVMGDKPDVIVKGQIMTVTLAPAKGFAGRPSSDRMIKAALKR